MGMWCERLAAVCIRRRERLGAESVFFWGGCLSPKLYMQPLQFAAAIARLCTYWLERRVVWAG